MILGVKSTSNTATPVTSEDVIIICINYIHIFIIDLKF